MNTDQLYTLENAIKYQWSSISGDLHPERVQHLRTHSVGTQILDAGCGGGGFVNFLTEQGFDVTGIDYHAEFLGVAEERGYRGTFLQGDITDLPFADKSFDFSYCYDVLEHVDDRLAVSELARVTRQRILVAVPKEDETITKYGLTFNHYKDNSHLRYYTEHSLRELMDTLGPSNIHVSPELKLDLKMIVNVLLKRKYDLTSTGGQPQLTPNFSLKDRIVNSMIRRLLRRSALHEIYTGLVAVVDL